MCLMPRNGRFPRKCFELLGAIREHGSRIPFADLPERLREIGLLKVCRDYGIVELVLWYESTGGVSLCSGDSVVVLASPTWIPFYQMARSSIEEAIERDAGCEDPKKRLHVALTPSGDLAFEEDKLDREHCGSGVSAGPGYIDIGEDLPERVRRLKKSHGKAHLERQYAQKRCPDLKPDQPGDKAAHDWLTQHGNEDGERPAAPETWLRYLREARKMLRVHVPSRGREHGGSLVHQNRL